jgi:hypothetical protein
MVVLFERDESLAGMVLAQLRALGYECRAARIPVEVFDLIARYPVGLVLVNLGQAATGRRDFWVALENKQRERGVQYLTYRLVVPGIKPDPDSLLNGRVDVEISGLHNVLLLVEKVRAVLPPPARPAAAPENRPAPAAPAAQPPPALAVGPTPYASFAPTPESVTRPAIAGVMNLSNGQQPGQQAEFFPLPNEATQRKSALGQVAQMAAYAGQGYPGQGYPGQGYAANGMSSTSRTLNGVGPAPTSSAQADPPPVPAMPMGDLASLTAAINALAEAGAPGYHHAAAMVQAMEQTTPGTNGDASRRRPSGDMGQEASMSNPQGMGNGTSNGAARQAAEALAASYQAMAEVHQAQNLARSQEAQARVPSRTLDEYERYRREPPAPPQEVAGEASGDSWRPSGGLAAAAPAAYQQQMLAPVALLGQVERSLGTVLVEGQLISAQRLEIALGIQRLLRGADIDYRLGELLLMFKFLTPDQLLAALLVSRGMVTPAQVAAMGRIKQELHHIGMEYDLENLLILFRLLTSEQLREIRSEFP